MQFVREVINSSLIEHIINLPEELQHKRVEILIFPFSENINKHNFNPEDFQGVIKLENIEEEISKIRNE